MASVFPSAVATQLDLLTAVNGLTCTLDGDIDDLVDSIPVDSTDGFPNSGYISIDEEVIYYASKTSNAFTNCTRGADDTDEAEHQDGDVVGARDNAAYHNTLTLELVGIEQNLSDRFGLSSASPTAQAFTRQTIYQVYATAGNTASMGVRHTETANGASHARLLIETGGASGGDPYIHFFNNVLSWAMGIDNSSSDKFVLARSSSLGTSNWLEATDVGFNIVGANFSVNRTASAATVLSELINSDNGNTASHARFTIQSTGAGGGDPYASFVVDGVTTYSIGIDNSDSDALCITAASTLNGTNLWRMTSAALSVNVAPTFTVGPIIFTTAGDSIIRVVTSSSGNWVGMNLRNDVVSTAYFGMETSGDAGGGAFTGCGASALVMYHAGNFPLCFVTNDVKRLEITGAGAMTYSFANSGATNTFTVENTSNTADSHSRIIVKVGGTSAGDPYIFFDGTGSDFSIGMDNSDGNKLKFSNATGIGTNDRMVLTVDGELGIGVTTPESYNSALRSLVVLGGHTARATATNGTNYIGFTDATGSTVQGLIQYNHNATGSNETMTFRVNSTDWWNLNAIGDWIPIDSTGTQDIGSSTQYMNEINYKVITDRGCIPWCDDGVELNDGRRVSDLKALCAIKKHPTRKTPSGLPRLDYATFPKHAFKNVENDKKCNFIERDKNGDAWAMIEKRRLEDDGTVTIVEERVQAQDGVEMTMMFGVFIGAFKEVNGELEDLKQQAADLEKRIATLEKAA